MCKLLLLGLVLRTALVYATKLKQRRERYQGGIKALADQMQAIVTSQGTSAQYPVPVPGVPELRTPRPPSRTGTTPLQEK